MRWWCILFHFALVTITGCFTTSENSSLFSTPPCTCSDASVLEQKERTEENNAPHQGGSLRIRIASEPNSLLSLVDPEPVVRLIADGDMFESLVQVSADGNTLTPALAVSWTEHPDSISYTFLIDPTAVWHDGKRVTARDVKYTFSKIRDPDSQVAVKREFSDISEIKVRDDHTITIKLDGPRPGFLISLANVAILPAHVFGRTPLASHPAARAPIGSGPFKFSRWVSGQVIELERNPAWRGKRPSIDKIVYRLVIDHEIAINLFKKNELDIVLDVPSSTMLNQLDERLISYPLDRFEAWITNTTRPVFSTPAARLAVGMLIDRATIRCSILRCRADFAEGPWLPIDGEHTGFPPPFQFDPARATKLLETKGWQDTNKDGTLDRDGVEFAFELLLPDASRDLRRMATVIQNDLAKAGIKMHVITVDLSTYLSRLRTRRYDASVITVANHKMFDPSPLFHSRSIPQGENFCGFSDPELDVLLDALRGEKEPLARLDLQRQISASLRASGPAVFTFRPYDVALLKKHVKAAEIRHRKVNTPMLWLDKTQSVGSER
jgi:peptide/nickel transport system substrate-binding protein